MLELAAMASFFWMMSRFMVESGSRDHGQSNVADPLLLKLTRLSTDSGT